jgi:hypothetical protein
MKYAAPLLFFLAACPVFSQTKNEQRLSGLEKRVSKVEQRVTKLEGGAPAAAAAEKKPANPIAAYFMKKKPVVGQGKIGVKLYVELENTSNLRYYAFNGILVFRDESGAAVWSKPYAYSEPLYPGDKVQVVLAVSSDQTKEYLKLIKAKTLTASLEKQEAYGSD